MAAKSAIGGRLQLLRPSFWSIAKLARSRAGDERTVSAARPSVGKFPGVRLADELIECRLQRVRDGIKSLEIMVNPANGVTVKINE